MPDSVVIKIDQDRWEEAQRSELEFAKQSVNNCDDYNHWWFEAFDNYHALQERTFINVLEVGCGPHTNVRLILPLIKFKNLWLEDPLIQSYTKLRSKKRFLRFFKLSIPVAVTTLHQNERATLLSEPLENLPLLDHSIDLCICINVLDHVRDADLCIREMRRVLRKNGYLVIGQDLSNYIDMKLCPESWHDVGHPIKIDEFYLNSQLGGLKSIYKVILPREQGRNPRCHYGTYIFIGQQSYDVLDC